VRCVLLNFEAGTEVGVWTSPEWRKQLLSGKPGNASDLLGLGVQPCW